ELAVRVKRLHDLTHDAEFGVELRARARAWLKPVPDDRDLPLYLPQAAFDVHVVLDAVEHALGERLELVLEREGFERSRRRSVAQIFLRFEGEERAVHRVRHGGGS